MELIAILVATYILSSAFAPKPPQQKPAAFEDFDFPLFEEGEPKTAVFGQCWSMAGWVEWPIGSGEYDRRHIDRHVGTELRLLGGTAGIPASATLRVLPGCDFLFGTCTGKFANGVRFRGVPNLERRSPFDGNAVW